MSEDFFVSAAERILEDRARLEVLEAAFLNLLSLTDKATLRAFEIVFREGAERHLMAAGDRDLDHATRLDMAALALGKRIEAILARGGGA
jgi:hypothetical protein